jgi:hypothetical protein
MHQPRQLCAGEPVVTLKDALATAFLRLLTLQNDATPVNARDSAWLKDHEGQLGDAQEAVMAAHAELPAEGASPPELDGESAP